MLGMQPGLTRACAARRMTLIPRADRASLSSLAHNWPLFCCPSTPASTAAFPAAREKGGFLPCLYHQAGPVLACP